MNCVFPIHPRTKERLDNFGMLNKLKFNPRCHLIDPLGYIDFMNLQKDATVILTDSDGIQGESTFFNVPCLTIRDNTERPVTISHGTNKLIGTEDSNIPNEIARVMSKPIEKKPKPALWDGKASNRIAEIINNYF